MYLAGRLAASGRVQRLLFDFIVCVQELTMAESAGQRTIQEKIHDLSEITELKIIESRLLGEQ